MSDDLKAFQWLSISDFISSEWHGNIENVDSANFAASDAISGELTSFPSH